MLNLKNNENDAVFDEIKKKSQDKNKISINEMKLLHSFKGQLK